MISSLIESRQIRIFISSTFRDMMAERDHLVRKVFPALRRYCAERDVTLQELDLRWGISEEESKQGKVVDICLKEIQKTTSFFIGLLGERYGWVPSENERGLIAENTPVFEEYPWVEDELKKGTSITEIEIQEGVLRNKEKLYAYFYFRSPRMEVEENFKEKPGSYEAEKLSALKTTLRQQQDYPVEDYNSIEHLGSLVEADFKALVDRLFPEGALSPLEKERLQQRIFLKSRTAVYVPKAQWYETLDEFVRNDERALVIAGGSGTGKSALFANWIAGRGEQSSEKIIYHFIGESSAEGDYRKITGRLINELRDIYGFEQKENAAVENGNKEKPQEVLQNLLFQTAGKGKLIIVLDGMDKLFETDNAKLINWLPAYPENVKLIFSTVPQDVTYDAFSRRDFRIFTPEPLAAAERECLIGEYLKLYGKALAPERTLRIAKDTESENPLALITLLDELRVFGVHEELDTEINRYLAADSLEQFFALVLEGLEKTYMAGEMNLVKEVFCLIAASRAGLSEAEILEITGTNPLYWSQLSSGAAGRLATRNGLVTFSHGFIREAVRIRYLSGDNEETRYRRRIVAAMEKSGLQNRKYDELPYQLRALAEWDALYNFLLDFDVFEYIYKKDIYEIGAYWRALLQADSAKYSLEKYLILDSGGRSDAAIASLYSGIAQVISDLLGDYTTALEYDQKALEIREAVLGANHLDTAYSYNDIGCVYYSLGDYEKMLKYQQKALEISEAVLGAKHPEMAISYNNIGIAYCSLRDYGKALEYYQKALEIQEAVLGAQHPDTAMSYNNIGSLYGHLENYEKTLEYCQKSLEIREAVLGIKHPDTAHSYNNIGIVYKNIGDYDKALEYYWKSLEIVEAVLGTKHFDTACSYTNIGNVYDSLGDYEKALEYYWKVPEIFEAVLGAQHPSTAMSYNTIGNTYASQKDHAKALEYHRKALEIRAAVLGENHLKTADSYANAGADCYALDDYAKALEYRKKALEITEAMFGKNHPETAMLYMDIGNTFHALEDYKTALEYCKKALEIEETAAGKNHPGTAWAYYIAGIIYNSLKDTVNALEYHRQALAIFEALGEECAENAQKVRETIAQITAAAADEQKELS